MVHIFLILFDTITVLFYPAVFLLVAGIIALIFWRKLFSRILLGIALLYFYCSATGLLPSGLMRHLEKTVRPFNSKKIMTHRAMIVLGGGIDNYPNEIEPATRSYARALEAYRIYKLAQTKHIQYMIFLSGGYTGKNKSISEAMLYKRMLLQMGVPNKYLITENKSLDTYQNAKYLKPILEKYPFKQYLLITSALHMPRAMRYFYYFHIKTIASPSDYPYATLKWTPTEYNLSLQEAALNEYIDSLRFRFYDFISVYSWVAVYPSLNTY